MSIETQTHIVWRQYIEHRTKMGMQPEERMMLTKMQSSGQIPPMSEFGTDGKLRLLIQTEESNTEYPSLFETFEIIQYHFAASYDWESFTETYIAPSLDDAVSSFYAKELNNNCEEESLRIYTIIQDGEIVEVLERKNPDLTKKYHFVYQAERSINVVTVVPEENMSFEKMSEIALSNVPKDSDVHYRDVKYADMIVKGGKVVFVNSL